MKNFNPTEFKQGDLIEIHLQNQPTIQSAITRIEPDKIIIGGNSVISQEKTSGKWFLDGKLVERITPYKPVGCGPIGYCGC